MRNILYLALILLTAVGDSCGRSAWATPPLPPPMKITQVRTFMYQLQDLEKGNAVAALAASDFDMLVVEPVLTLRGEETFDTAAMVRKLRAGRPGRLVIAYLDVGQAESYRSYWQKNWKAPKGKKAGIPSFILEPDPDGWNENFVVAYWDRRWQQVIAGGPKSVVRQVMQCGFDGVYLDWIDAYDDNTVKAAARKQGVKPVQAMVDFIDLIGRECRKANPSAVVIAQNAIRLIDEDPRYIRVIDAIGVEDTFYSGKADAKWNSPRAGDIPNRSRGRDEDSPESRMRQYGKYLAAGKPVFTIDYCVKPANAAKVYAAARAHGLVPLVTRVSLEKMTPTPPPDLPAAKGKP